MRPFTDGVAVTAALAISVAAAVVVLSKDVSADHPFPKTRVPVMEAVICDDGAGVTPKMLAAAVDEWAPHVTTEGECNVPIRPYEGWCPSGCAEIRVDMLETGWDHCVVRMPRRGPSTHAVVHEVGHCIGHADHMPRSTYDADAYAEQFGAAICEENPYRGVMAHRDCLPYAAPEPAPAPAPEPEPSHTHAPSPTPAPQPKVASPDPTTTRTYWMLRMLELTETTAGIQPQETP